MRLKKLERSLSVNLVVRSSRHIRFTSEGERLVAEAQGLLEHINALPGALAGAGRSLAGRLHVMSSFGFGRLHIAPLIAQFVAAHPSVHVTLDLSEKPWAQSNAADIVIHIGAVRDSSWVAHLRARNARWVCASHALSSNILPAKGWSPSAARRASSCHAGNPESRGTRRCTRTTTRS